MSKTAVFIIRRDVFSGLEGYTARRMNRYLLKEGDHEGFDIYELDNITVTEVIHSIKFRDYRVIVVIHDDIFITSESIIRLSRIAEGHQQVSAVVPVSNESRVLHQKYAPPFPYQTPSVFKWAVSGIYKRFGNKIIEVRDIDDFCLAFIRDVLNTLHDDYQLKEISGVLNEMDMRFGVAKGIYVHRYGDCYESSREDIIKLIPADAVDVLDVGCANGLFGEMLKKRQKCVLTGIDSDKKAVEVARERLDTVIQGDVEEIIERGVLEEYDCIVCGDVLEHLNNPWGVVAGLKKHLKKGGLFIASTPNILSWAILYEMLNGRWDYVPFSILSGTHIRFFTKSTLKELFEENGYKIKQICLQQTEMPVRAKEFVKDLKRLFPGVNEDELKAPEILIVAQKA